MPEASQHQFLDLLDSDPARAEAQYRVLRAKLVAYFQHNRAHDAAEAADETIKRALGRLAEGANFQAGVAAYCYGIAKHVLQEDRRKRAPEELKEGTASASVRVETALLPPEAALLVDQCMSELSASDRKLFLRYHVGDREQLASELGISQNALRIRAFRIRESIEPRLRAKANKKILK